MKKIRNTLYADVKDILHRAKQNAYRAVNFSMVVAYWHIGRRIVEQEQGGKARAGYGDTLVKDLSKKLTRDYGKGYSFANLKNFRQFYLTFHDTQKSYAVRSQLKVKSNLPVKNQKSYAVRSQLEIPAVLQKELSWTHYRLLMRVENPAARNYYLEETIAQNWSTRALERQINTFYYERLLSSKNKKKTRAEAKQKTRELLWRPEDFIKDPFVLEFLNLPSGNAFPEKDIEAAIINKLQQFLLEMGKGFSFVARQKRISAEDEHFYVDLVFYNYILKCFVLTDLKLGKLSHQDIGQMDLYVRWYEDNEKPATDNPTIGIILCSQKNETIVKYSVLKESKQLFASRYKLYLPTETELKKELEHEIRQFKLRQKN